MKSQLITHALCATVLLASASAPAMAGHRDNFYPRHHSYRHHHHSDWGWYLGLSTLLVLPEIIRQSQADYYPTPYASNPYYTPYAPNVSLTPVTTSLNTPIYSATFEHENALAAENSADAYANESVAQQVLRIADSEEAAKAAQAMALPSVRSLPANARVIQTENGTEYEWQGQRYRFDWQTEMYQPLNR
ncbi:hypothetical protein JYB87_16010 [Shewanella avicenniae]|uniref:Uncharacterized protein n=1 Tax=Shewanella avicenniae TaxID=2814294 RepID=A0ABX7QQQ9_9GAMM|nr:hypothetical protein [Shewanella avicenniae]QSX33208.1 hypothetical protein JYB87_16010 [Shewanella avicenniae]